MSPDKAPGPDGFPAIFYHAMWNITSIQQVIDISFVHRDFLLRSFNQSYITLVPKGNKQETFGDFRPINLRNVIYKFTSKSLAYRIK